MNTSQRVNTSRNVVSGKVIYPELSYAIIGVLFAVHNELGQYAREKQYADLLEKRLKEVRIAYRREFAIGESGNILDFVVDGKIVIELKATRVLVGEHYRQVQNYLQQSNLKLGILVNFRQKYLKPARVIRIDKDTETNGYKSPHTKGIRNYSS